MRKRILSVLVPLFLVCILSANAVQAIGQRMDMKPDLSFDGTTAICSGICQGNTQADSIDVTLTLYQGKNYINSWSSSGTGRVILSKECKVTSGKTYRLEMVCSINGVTIRIRHKYLPLTTCICRLSGVAPAKIRVPDDRYQIAQQSCQPIYGL